MADDSSSSAIKSARWVALTNGHYHSEREAFLDSVDRVVTFVVLLAGAGTVTSAIDESMRTISAIAVTVFAMAQLVFSLGPAARKHSNLREKYFDIAADLEGGKLNPAEAHSNMLRLAGSEGTIYAAAHAVSENWSKQAIYGSDAQELCKVNWVRRALRHIWRQSAHDFHC